MQGHTYSASCVTVVVMLLVTHARREVTAAVATAAAASCSHSDAAPTAVKFLESVKGVRLVLIVRLVTKKLVRNFSCCVSMNIV